MKQVLQVQHFGSFSGKKGKTTSSHDHSHKCELQVTRASDQELVIEWSVHSDDSPSQVLSDVDVLFSMFTSDPNASCILQDATCTDWRATIAGGQVYRHQMILSHELDASCTVTFQVDYQLLAVLKPVYGDALAIIDDANRSLPPASVVFPPRTSRFLQDKRLSDVTFIVDRHQHEFLGNRTIISLRSQRLQDMLFPITGVVPAAKPRKESRNGTETTTAAAAEAPVNPPVIHLPDVSWPAFLTLMRFLYREELVIDRRFIPETLAAAERFDVKEIIFAIACLMDVNVLPDVLNYAMTEERVDRLRDVWYICLHDHVQDHLHLSPERSFLLPERFNRLTDLSIRQVVRDERLQVPHEILWKLCLEWAGSQLTEKDGRDVDGGSDDGGDGGDRPSPAPVLHSLAHARRLRQLMRPFLFDLRYWELGFKSFTEGPASSGVLSLREAMSVYKILVFNEDTHLFQEDDRRHGDVREESDDDDGDDDDDDGKEEESDDEGVPETEL